MNALRHLGCALLLAGIAPLAACGFRPLYGDAGRGDPAVQRELASIGVAPVADRAGQMLRNELERRLTPDGEPARAAYRLEVKLAESIRGLGIRRDATATVGEMTVVATYRLRPSGADTQLVQGETRSTISYNISSAEYATLVAENDARARAVRELATAIAARLAAHFSAPPVPAAALPTP